MLMNEAFFFTVKRKFHIFIRQKNDLKFIISIKFYSPKFYFNIQTQK